MLRLLVSTTLVSSAAAAHLSGPMDDQMNICMSTNCPDFSTFMTAANFQGTGLNFATFGSPPFNSNPFIYDMAYATNVLGLNGATGNFTYRNESGAPQTLVASATTDYTATFTCVCQNCGPTIEAIFQPIGRAICKTVNQDLPCATEFDACKSANAATITSTGSLAGGDLLYPAVGGPGTANAMASSADPCHPEAAFFGYKVGYNLASDCNSDGTALCAGGGPTAKALAECVAASRITACAGNSTCLAHIPTATSCVAGGETACGASAGPSRESAATTSAVALSTTAAGTALVAAFFGL